MARSRLVLVLLAASLVPGLESSSSPGHRSSGHAGGPLALLRELGSLAKYEKSANYSININKHIDDNIEHIRNGLKEVDPRDLRDIKRSFGRAIYTHLYSGWLQHLSKLKRSGDCSIRYSSKVLNIDLNFEWDELLFNYRYLLKFLLLSQRGDVYGQMKEAKINLSLDVDLKTYQVVLKRLHFDEAKRVKVWIEGRVFEEIYNLFLGAVTRVAKRAVLERIQSTAIELIELDIADLNNILGKGELPEFTFVNLADMDLMDDAE